MVTFGGTFRNHPQMEIDPETETDSSRIFTHQITPDIFAEADMARKTCNGAQAILIASFQRERIVVFPLFSY